MAKVYSKRKWLEKKPSSTAFIMGEVEVVKGYTDEPDEVDITLKISGCSGIARLEEYVCTRKDANIAIAEAEAFRDFIVEFTNKAIETLNNTTLEGEDNNE